MNHHQKTLLSELMQQATRSAASGDIRTACRALEQILATQRDSLSLGERSRAQGLLDLIRKRGARQATPTQERIPVPLNDQGGKHHPLQEVPWPKISIVTPTYNQGQFIEDTILSVLNQNYPNLEYIIIDGGSSDRTLEVIEKHKSRISRVISEPDKGQSNAINKGMRLVTGEILHWLNSDDMLEPNTLLYVGLKFLETDFDLLAGTCTPFDHESGRLNNRHMATMPFSLRFEDITDIEATWLKGMYFHQPEVFFSRRLWEAAGGYVDEALYYSMDYDLWARMAQVSDFPVRVFTAGKSFCLYREHSNQKTSTVEAYLPELLSHSKVLRERHLGSSAKSAFSSAQRYRQKLSIVSISDFGFNGGAGVAHKRVCQVLQAAGHEVTQLTGFQHWQSETLDLPVESFTEALEILDPDLVLLGNLHNLKRGLSIAEHCSRHFPTLAIAHDFWWITGRCAYTHGCHYLYTRCSIVCPTPQEYPRLDPPEIDFHHQRKKQLLQHPNFHILANSSYTHSVYSQAKESWSIKTNPIGIVALPIAPEGDLALQSKEPSQTSLNRVTNSGKIRVLLGCTDHGDFRKGTDLCIVALQRLMAKHLEIQVDVYGRNCDLIINSLPEFSNRIFLHGFLTSQNQYFDLLRSSDIFIGTSREETLGQTFVEAAHAGLITVGPIDSGYADLVRSCRFSIGYRLSDVVEIISALELAVAIVSRQDRQQIRSIQQAQARASFSGMTFLSDFNGYLYSSGLWKRLRYHSATKLYDLTYSLSDIDELVLASASSIGRFDKHNKCSSSTIHETLVPIDSCRLGPGLYLETAEGKSVLWLKTKSTLIIANDDQLLLHSISLNCHWIPESMRESPCILTICGIGEYRSCVPIGSAKAITFDLGFTTAERLVSLPKLLVSLVFVNSFTLEDGRRDMCVVCDSFKLVGALP